MPVPMSLTCHHTIRWWSTELRLTHIIHTPIRVTTRAWAWPSVLVWLGGPIGAATGVIAIGIITVTSTSTTKTISIKITTSTAAIATRLIIGQQEDAAREATAGSMIPNIAATPPMATAGLTT